MKKIAAALISLILVLALAGCGTENDLPSGEKARIDFIDGWKAYGCSFEYINENTVKLVREDDGQVFYVPASSILRIWESSDSE